MNSTACRTKLRVFIVDDHPVVLAGMSRAIDDEPDLIVCGEALDEQQTLAQIGAARPDVALIDLKLKDNYCFSLIEKLHSEYPRLPILIMTMHEETAFAARALEAGAKGYLLKNEAVRNLVAAIRSVLVGQVYLSEDIKAGLAARVNAGKVCVYTSPVAKLSVRELEVYQMIGAGMVAKEIAYKLGLDASTVESYRARIKKKLGLGSGVELMQHAINWKTSGNQVRM